MKLLLVLLLAAYVSCGLTAPQQCKPGTGLVTNQDVLREYLFNQSWVTCGGDPLFLSEAVGLSLEPDATGWSLLVRNTSSTDRAHLHVQKGNGLYYQGTGWSLIDGNNQLNLYVPGGGIGGWVTLYTRPEPVLEFETESSTTLLKPYSAEVRNPTKSCIASPKACPFCEDGGYLNQFGDLGNMTAAALMDTAWLLCGGQLFPFNTIGIEFTPQPTSGQRWIGYLLADGANGRVNRSIEIAWSGDDSDAEVYIWEGGGVSIYHGAFLNTPRKLILSGYVDKILVPFKL